MMAIAGGSEGEREPAGARYGVRRIWIPQSQHTVDSGEYTEGIDRRLGGWSSGRDEVAAVWLSRPETERNSALGGEDGGDWSVGRVDEEREKKGIWACEKGEEGSGYGGVTEKGRVRTELVGASLAIGRETSDGRRGAFVGVSAEERIWEAACSLRMFCGRITYAETGEQRAAGVGRGRGLQLVMADRLRHPQI